MKRTEARLTAWRALLLAALAALVTLLTLASAASAQTATALPPALPIVYTPVTARVDGQPTADLSGLTVRVGDWTGTAQRLNDGSYLLIVGPPDTSYIGKRVTFHLDGAQATLAYDFPNLAQPRFETVELAFARGQAGTPPAASAVPVTPAPDAGAPPSLAPPSTLEPTPTLTASATPAPTAAAAASDGGEPVPWARVGLIAVAGLALFVVLSWGAGRLSSGR